VRTSFGFKDRIVQPRWEGTDFPARTLESEPIKLCEFSLRFSAMPDNREGLPPMGRTPDVSRPQRHLRGLRTAHARRGVTLYLPKETSIREEADCSREDGWSWQIGSPLLSHPDEGHPPPRPRSQTQQQRLRSATISANLFKCRPALTRCARTHETRSIRDDRNVLDCNRHIRAAPLGRCCPTAVLD